MTNTGTQKVSGSWVDSVYLASGPATTYQSGDALLERIPHSGTLTPGAHYTGHITAQLPVVPAGPYHLIVVPDGRISWPQQPTTSRLTRPKFAVAAIPTLSPGTPVHATIKAGQDEYYQVAVGKGSDVSVAVTTPAAGDADVYGALGNIPGPSSFTLSSTPNTLVPSVVLPKSSAGTWYLDIHGDAGAGSGKAITITPTLVGLAVSSVSPAKLGANGPATVTLQGSGFDPGMKVHLVHGSTSISATDVQLSSSTTAFATFTLTGAATGTYDVVVTSGATTVTVHGAVRVQSTDLTTSGLFTHVGGAGTLRYGWFGRAWVPFVNTTGHDIYIPVVKLSGATMLVTLSGGKRLGKTEYLMDPNFSTPRGVPYPDGVLPPHATATLYFDAISTTLVSQAVLSVHVKVLDSTESTPVNWTTELAGDRPANITDASWTTIVHDVATVFGATDGSYATTLAGMMNQAATDGVTFTTESQALDWALQQVMAEGAGTSVSGTLYKGNTTTPFGRTTLELVSADGSQVDTATTWYGGQFNFWGVPAGTYHLVVPGFEPPSNGTFTVPPTGIGHHLNVVALPGATVQGTITDGTTSKPVAGATVSVTETGGSTSSAPTGANGTYTLSGVVPGPVTLVASGPGVVTSTPVHLTVSTSAPTTQNFALSGGGSISGKVQATHGGPPPAGTTVSAIPGSPSAAPVSGAVKSDGTFTISGLQAGAYTVKATARPRSPCRRRWR